MALQKQWKTDRLHDIDIGAVYTVYAIRVYPNLLEYLIADKETGRLGWPQAYPVDAFEIVDPRISASWHVSVVPAVVTALESAVIWMGNPRWLDDKDFRENLYDGQVEAVKDWATIMREMDAEFGA